MRHSRSRPCRAEWDTHDGTYGFHTVDYGPFATQRSQTRSFAALVSRKRDGFRIAAGSSSWARGLVHDPPEFDSQRPAPSPPAPLPQTSLGERGARAKGRVRKWCSGLWVGWHAQSVSDGRGTHRLRSHPYRHSSRPSQGLPHSPTKRDSTVWPFSDVRIARLPDAHTRPPGDKLARLLARRHELATHDSRDSMPITDPPVRRQKSLATTTPADKIRDGDARTLALNSRSPRPTSVSPLTASGLVHPGSGGSLLHSFPSPRTVTMMELRQTEQQCNDSCPTIERVPGRRVGAYLAASFLQFHFSSRSVWLFTFGQRRRIAKW